MSGNGAFVPRRFALGGFADPHALVAAASRLRGKGLGRVDTHSPFPIHGLDEALGLGRPRVPLLVLLGGLLGALSGYSLIVLTNAVDWPLNIGGRPPHSPPANIPVTFELGVLFGAGFAFFGLMILIGLPRPYHPVFQSPAFARASVDRFFVSVELPPGAAADPVLDELRAAGGADVELVEEWER
jgi:hypothetical protein